MRWFILVLIVANVGLYFWLQYDALPEEPVLALPPPDIGRLQLLQESEPPPSAIVTETVTEGASSTDRGRVPERSERADAPRLEPSEPSARTADIPSSAVPLGPLADLADPLSPRSPAADTDTVPVERRPQLDAAAATVASDAPASLEVPDPVPVPPLEAIEPSLPGDAVPVDAPVSLESPRDTSGVEASGGEVPAPAQVEPDLPLAQAAESRTPGAPQTEPEPEPGPPPVMARCARVGPLEPETADRLIAGLPVYIQLLSDATEEVVEVDGYYVMIPPLASRSEGLKVLAQLEDKGITDTWLFPRGVYRNAISLGLYRREAGALRHQRNVVAKGFDAEVVERTARREVRRLLLKNVDGGDIELSVALPQGASAESIACP